VIELRAGAATDVGLVRTTNQDELLLASPLFAVADGMGGPAAGEVAAATAITHLHEAFVAAGEATADALLEAAQAANRAVWDQAEANPEMRGMGTTLVALALVNDGRLAVINIGDSRLYVLHVGELRQVTSDHNLVAELVAEGRLSKEEAEFHPRRNVITRAIGVDPHVPADLFTLDPVPGDRFLLCSDGLFRELSDDQIAALLRRLADPEDAARELVTEAKFRGGSDNITVIVVDAVDPDAVPDLKHALAVGDTGDSGSSGNSGEAERVAEAGDAAGASGSRSDTRPGDTRRTRATRPRRRMITLRVVVFSLGVLTLLVLAAAGIAWYGRTSYFVGLSGDRVIIYQGRPGGVLWLRPTVADATDVTTADVLPRHLPALTAGQQEPSLSAARLFVTSMVTEKQAAQPAPRPPATTLPPKPRTTTPTTR
jgi:protein phosphatase